MVTPHRPTRMTPGHMRERRTVGVITSDRAVIICGRCDRPVYYVPRTGTYRHGDEPGWTQYDPDFPEADAVVAYVQGRA